MEASRLVVASGFVSPCSFTSTHVSPNLPQASGPALLALPRAIFAPSSNLGNLMPFPLLQIPSPGPSDLMQEC